MADKTGVARLRQAVENQYAVGEGEFRLPFANIATICDEIEEEFARLSWAQGIPVPVDADGEVVPLTTRVMYFGDSPRDITGFHYSAGNGWELYTTTLHTCLSTFNLHCPDSWERLENDVKKYEDSMGAACSYYNQARYDCTGCPGKGYKPCFSHIASDVLRRAKALAEKGDD